MAFKRAILEPWVGQTKRSDGYGFEDTQKLRFGDHPFKITEVSSGAPQLTLDKNLIDPTFKNEFDLVVNVSEGKLYDLNRFFPNITIPLYISKRRDGEFVIIQGNNNRVELPDGGWDTMSVPVTISNPYTLKIKTQSGFTDVSKGSGMMFFEVVFRDLTTVVANNSARIQSASILTDVQLKAKYPGTLIDQFGAELPQRYRNRVRVFVFYSPENCRYVCLNSARYGFTKGLPLPPVSSYSEDFKKRLALEDSGGGAPFYFTFIPMPSSFPTLRNDLFLRIS